LIKLLTN